MINSPSKSKAELRQRALALINGNLIDEVAPSPRIKELLQELQIHQIELEMQNEALQKAHADLISSKEKYQDLFYAAPVAYIVCDIDGIIVEANNTSLKLLGVKKCSLINRSFPGFSSSDYQDTFYLHTRKLLASNTMQTCEIQLLLENDELIFVRIDSVIEKSSEEEIFVRSVLVDITERKKISNELIYQASHDSLTNLINRREFERIARALIENSWHYHNEHALCFLDLDQFKVINDTSGHQAGDEMLRQLTYILKNTVRKVDTLARLGGDEFGVLIENCSLNDAYRVAISLQNAIQNYQFTWEEHIFKVGVSMGLVSITNKTLSLTELLKNADSACYIAKDSGRNRIHIYHNEDSDIARREGEMQWVEQIYLALGENRFCLNAQLIEPVINNGDKHFEFLIRMLDEDGESIPPGAFLPAAERYNLITQIDKWVIRNALSLLLNQPEFFKKIKFCSINLSGQTIANPESLQYIICQLEESGIDADKICFEITETAAISNLKLAMEFIATLKKMGCRFALDDFGSGLSSFAYLKNLPVDYLKIDGIFVKDIVEDPIDHAMVKSINEIGHVMGMQTIAEFVENDLIKNILKEIGVDYLQGYGIRKPMPFQMLIDELNVEKK